MRNKYREIVSTVINRCLGYKKGERLLIVTDDKLFSMGEIFYQGALYLGIDAVLLKIRTRNIHGEEPPNPVAEILKKVNLALLVTEKSLSHTHARRTASKKFGVRIASLPGITEEIFGRSLLIDYERLKTICKTG